MNRLHRILTLHGVSRSMFLHVRLCVLGEGRTKSEQPPNYPNRDLRTPNRDLRTPDRNLRRTFYRNFGLEGIRTGV